jgi:starvation-inducible DNA-binding protein
MGVNIGLTEEQREGVAAILNTLLSDEYLLYTKTRNYHWNVVGPQFHDLHKFFETQYSHRRAASICRPTPLGIREAASRRSHR